MTTDYERGTGRTTEIMRNAPQNSVFVWCNEQLDTPRMIAEKIGRKDLEIVSPLWIKDRRFMGRNLTGITIDHDAVVGVNLLSKAMAYVGRL